MKIVADSSPLIAFAILEKLDLLPKIFSDIYIPHSVYDEITRSGKPYFAELTAFSEKKVRHIQNRLAVEMLANELDLGESEAIVLALENQIENILIDEHKGRRVARSKGLFPIGTIGVLIQAKYKGEIKKVKPHLNRLVQNKIRISEKLYLKALELAVEI